MYMCVCELIRICDLSGDVVVHDDDSCQLQYLMVTRETAFELDFLKRFDAELSLARYIHYALYIVIDHYK